MNKKWDYMFFSPQLPPEQHFDILPQPPVTLNDTRTVSAPIWSNWLIFVPDNGLELGEGSYKNCTVKHCSQKSPHR